MADARAAVYASNGEGDELTGLNSMRVQIIRPSRVIGAPVESGQTSFDNKVLDPVKVIVNGTIVNKGDGSHIVTLRKLERMWANRDFEFYFASNGFDSQNDLILQNYPTTRDVDKFDFINVELTFVQAMLVSTEDQQCANGDDSDCKNNGYVQGVQK